MDKASVSQLIEKMLDDRLMTMETIVSSNSVMAE